MNTSSQAECSVERTTHGSVAAPPAPPVRCTGTMPQRQASAWDESTTLPSSGRSAWTTHITVHAAISA